MPARLLLLPHPAAMSLFLFTVVAGPDSTDGKAL